MTRNIDTLDLYELMPALYRLRDEQQGSPLRGLLQLIAQQAGIIKQNIDGLWDDFFIETCDEWVIPYIGDLVANNPFHEVAGRRRADVAKTIHYRRRKGTLSMLEQLARDVTGWGAHVVALFELLGWTQHENHLRFASTWANVRSLDVMDRVAGPFDETSHTVDVRHIAQSEGWHNIRNVGFFLWRLRHYPMAGVTPRIAANGYGYHFSPIGNPAPLFNKPMEEPAEGGLSDEVREPGMIRPMAFHLHTGSYYAQERSVFIMKDGAPVEIEHILCKDLSTWAEPPKGKVAVDVRLGRLAVSKLDTPPASLEVMYNYGFSADMGGGPYDRRRRRRRSAATCEPERATATDTVADPGALGALFSVRQARGDTIDGALQDWTTSGHHRAVIQIEDSKTYKPDTAPGPIKVKIPQGQLGEVPWLVIQAENRNRPTIIGDINVSGGTGVERLTLSGLLIAGKLTISGNIGELALQHCTLVPGGGLTEAGQPASPKQPSLVVDGSNKKNDQLHIEIDHCIVGGLNVPAGVVSLTVRDSIIDSLELPALAADDDAKLPGPPTTLERVTVFGKVTVQELTLCSDVIFTQPVTATRLQHGCVRFSYLAPGSKTPKQYRCQPNLAIETLVEERRRANPHLSGAEVLQIDTDISSQLAPAFTSRRFGMPAYAQLAMRCPCEITTGAEDGSEMGAFSELKQPQREANLRIRLEEYLPFGLDAGLIYVT